MQWHPEDFVAVARVRTPEPCEPRANDDLARPQRTARYRIVRRGRCTPPLARPPKRAAEHVLHDSLLRAVWKRSAFGFGVRNGQRNGLSMNDLRGEQNHRQTSHASHPRPPKSSSLMWTRSGLRTVTSYAATRPTHEQLVVESSTRLSICSRQATRLTGKPT